METKRIKKNSGFTLIELMVATAIFTVVMTVSLGALLVTLSTSKNARALQFAMDNVSFAMESMTRSLRMGTDYYCEDNYMITDCPNGSSKISFLPQGSSGNRVRYYLTQRGDGTYNIITDDGDSSEAVDLISPNINIEVLKFVVKGSSPNDNIQPSIHLMIKGSVKLSNKDVPFAIQTMISQRNFE